MAKFTCTCGFDLEPPIVITTKTIVAAIDRLHASFGDGYQFVPEHGGGIRFADWPGRKDGEYKALGFTDVLRTPSVSERTLQQWRTGPAIVLFDGEPDYWLYAIVKAYHGAPCWTKAELKKFRDALDASGIRCSQKISSTRLCSPANENDKRSRLPALKRRRDSHDENGQRKRQKQKQD